MMWYFIQTCFWQLFKLVRNNGADDVMTVRPIPQLIDAFRPFFARSLRYRTATSLVEMRNPKPVSMLLSSTRTVKLPALTTQDVVAGPLRAGVRWKKAGTPSPRMSSHNHSLKIQACTSCEEQRRSRLVAALLQKCRRPCYAAGRPQQSSCCRNSPDICRGRKGGSCIHGDQFIRPCN